MENERNPDVEALRSLCEREGGFRAVATAIEVNDQSLYQILSGVTLASGRQKGIGPKLRGKLDARYPGWRDQTIGFIGDKVLHAYLMTLAGALAKVDSASRRIAYLDALEAISRHHSNSLIERLD